MAARMELKELADGVVATVKKYVGASTDPLRTRLNAVEARVGALSLFLAKTPGDQSRVAQFEELFALLGELQRRVSALEDKVVEANA